MTEQSTVFVPIDSHMDYESSLYLCFSEKFGFVSQKFLEDNLNLSDVPIDSHMDYGSSLYLCFSEKFGFVSQKFLEDNLNLSDLDIGSILSYNDIAFRHSKLTDVLHMINLQLCFIYNVNPKCTYDDNIYHNIFLNVKSSHLCLSSVVSDQNLNSLYTNNNNNLTNDTDSVSVVNLSSFQLTDAMTSLLSKGLNFCPTPGEPDVHSLRQDLDKFHVSLRRTQFFSKQVGSTSFLDLSNLSPLETTLGSEEGPFDHYRFHNPSSWCPKAPIQLESMIMFNETHLSEYQPRAPGNQNLTIEEKQALADLKHNTDIVIKPADKGSAVVIQNRKDYIDEGLRQLRDTKFYSEVPTDLTPKHNQEVHDLIQDMVKAEEISDKCADYLYIDKPRTPQLYLLPKIHKNQKPTPGRPIVSGNSSPTERISQLADQFLQPLVQTTPSYVKDTTDFLCKLADVQELLPGTILCTIDVSSLYTNIPNNEGIQACAKLLRHSRPYDATPANNTITRLLDYVLHKNNFDFDGKHYLQVGGTAMGTKVAPSFANLFMADFEAKYVYTYPTKPSLWLRYIDDIFLIWEHSLDELHTFLEHLNTCHPTIKFTHELSTDSVNFLDTTVHTDNDGGLYTDLYCKPTDSHNYLRYESAHPQHCKKGLPYSQLLRVRRICSRLEDYDRNALMLCEHFHRRGYPSSIIEDALIRARRMSRDDLLNPQPKVVPSLETQPLFAISTYTPGEQPLRNIIQDNWPILGRTNTTANLHSKETIFGYRRNKNLRDLLVGAKLPDAQARPKLTAADPVSPMHTCKAKTKCNYCPKLDHSGIIVSTSTGRQYFSKKHISCRSNNLIYCITCNHCSLQYVGQTSNHIGERFKMHFQNIKTAIDTRKPQIPGKTKSKSSQKEEPIGRHFGSPNHHGTADITIHVLDFISAPPKCPPALALRDQLERKWMHRLQSISPRGLNLAD